MLLFLPYLVVTIFLLFVPLKFLDKIIKYDSPQTSVFGKDTTPPSEIKYIKNAPPVVDSNEINIKANAEANSTVLVYLNDKLAKTIKIGDSSKFDFDLTLEERENEVWAVVIDKNGNVGDPSGKPHITWTTFKD